MTIHETPGDRRVPARDVFDPTTGKFSSTHAPAREQLATWEGSVLPALQSALEARIETRGALVSHRLHEGPWMLTAEVRRQGEWAASKVIRLGCYQHVTQDIAMLVGLAVDCSRDHDASKAVVPACPVCQSIAGWAPMCSACRVQAASSVLPPAKIETKSPPCAGYALPSMPSGRQAMYVGPVSTLVDWRKLLVNKYEVTRADGPTDPCAPPEGFAFRRTADGIAVFREDGREFRMPNGARHCTYWDARIDAQQRERYPSTTNDAPGRWDGCEKARDWAAWALGETP